MDRSGPIFIIGAMGSGTTLLRLILDSHPRIAVPQETGFMRAERAHRSIPFKWSGRRWYLRLGWTHEEFRELQRDFYDTVFRRYAEKHGKVRWGEKTPLHTWHIDQMAKMFPDAVFVGVVRHPGAIVASNMTRWRHSLDKAAYHYERYTTELARQASRRPRRFAILRYEDLVLQPEKVLRELLDWLGEPWSDEVLAHHAVQGSRGAKLSVEGKVRVDDAIDSSRITKWTAAIDEHGRQVLDERLGRLGAFFGYSMADPATLEPVRRGKRLLIRGRDIRRRMLEFPDVDVSTQPLVPKFDRVLHPSEVTLIEAVPEPEPEPPGPLRRALRPAVRVLPAGVRRRISAAANVDTRPGAATAEPDPEDAAP